MLKKALKILTTPSITTTINPVTQLPSTRRTQRSFTGSIIDAALGREADLVPGSIVVCDLMGGYIDHSGIYVGEGNFIIERNGDSTIKKVTPHAFMNSHSVRTGLNLFVAYSRGSIISSQDIADRAKSELKDDSRYHILFNNCHRFTAYCATGVEHEVTTFDRLTEILESRFPDLHWVSVKNEYLQP